MKSVRAAVLGLAVDGRHKISALLLKPGPPLPAVSSAADLQKSATGIGVFSTVLIASVDSNGTCNATQTLGRVGRRPGVVRQRAGHLPGSGALQKMAGTPAGTPVAGIMAKNPGVATGSGWSYVGYKGGEDTGALTGSWYLRPSGGDATVAIAQFSAADPGRIPDIGWFAISTGGLLQHLPR